MLIKFAYPALILAAIIEQLSNPDEHNLLTAMIEVVSGKPASKAAILAGTM